MSAVTDSESIVEHDPENKPGISNLMTIYGSLTNKSYEEIEKNLLKQIMVLLRKQLLMRYVTYLLLFKLNIMKL